jgi:predicted transcriptional regulator
VKTAMMSIRAPFAEAIFAGKKQFEYRTRKPSFQGPTRVLVYVPGSPGRLRGEIIVDGILEGSPETVWRKTKDGGGITRSQFREYFAGRDQAFALRIRSRSMWDDSPTLDKLRTELGQSFRPPQFFMWLEAGRSNRRGRVVSRLRGLGV